MSFMPAWFRIINEMFGPEKIEELSIDDLPERSMGLRAGLEAMGVPARGVEAVIDAIPESHVYALRGLLESAIERNVPVQFTWLPGYDNEMTISEWADEPGKPCGITVIVRSRHVSDVRT